MGLFNNKRKVMYGSSHTYVERMEERHLLLYIYYVCLDLGFLYLYVSMQLDEAVIRALEVHLKCCRQKEQDGIISAG